MHVTEESLSRPSEDLADDAWNATLSLEIEELPRHWRAIRTTYHFYLEVQNGGLHQFFWNDRGEHADETFDDLLFIGATSFADIFRRARATYGSEGYPSHATAERNSWEEFTKAYTREDIKSLDREFYAQHPIKSLPDFIGDFIKARSQDYAEPKG